MVFVALVYLQTREMILVMDMKSSSKEETLSNVQDNSAEAQDIRHFKVWIRQSRYID
jgi:hypothetical protein